MRVVRSAFLLAVAVSVQATPRALIKYLLV